MEKPGKLFAIAKMCKKPLEKMFSSKTTCIFAKNVTLDWSFPFWLQPPGFLVCGISAPNGLI